MIRVAEKPQPDCTTVSLRAMNGEDVTAVMAIERRAYTFTWTEGIFSDCLRVGYVCKVASQGERVVGYAVMSTGAGECHVLNIGVDPDCQRRGIGTVLVTDLLNVARAQGVTMALLEVRASNQAAYALYRKLGFDEIGARKNYYPAIKGREDALLLARAL